MNVNFLRFKNNLQSSVFSFCIFILPESRINRLLGKVILIVPCQTQMESKAYKSIW